ncbi:hypothetical protein KW805_01030 [Candidatus Pacearchaeota archaeon]|nr:hypothetical protein [Candidatus Pacearchaeota archaeon]
MPHTPYQRPNIPLKATIAYQPATEENPKPGYLIKFESPQLLKVGNRLIQYTQLRVRPNDKLDKIRSDYNLNGEEVKTNIGRSYLESIIEMRAEEVREAKLIKDSQKTAVAMSPSEDQAVSYLEPVANPGVYSPEKLPV